MMCRRQAIRILCVTVFCVSVLSLMTSGLFAFTPQEERALKTLRAELEMAKTSGAGYVASLGACSSFADDFRRILERHSELGHPKTVLLDGKPVKILIPLNLNERTVGGFFQLSADGTRVLSWLPWNPDGSPGFVVSRKAWETAGAANDVPEAFELMPIKNDFTAGIPVEPSDIQDLYLIDHLDALSSKTQEDRKSYTDRAGLKSATGRRTGSSKCLSYASSIASDWWKIELGLKLGKYTSFVNGLVEYGLNPRLVEAYYAAVETSPYSFRKYTGKDRITGEKISYSPKHFAYVLSEVKVPAEVRDPLKSDITYRLPADGFGMDQPFFVVFNRSEGRVPVIREALRRYGILYAQHTMRLMHDKESLMQVGVHAVNIVGTGKFRGQEVVLYYETFGKNHRDYLEDSFYGPRLRAFPVKFFYQGIAFPHRISIEARAAADKATFRFHDFLGRPIVPERLNVELDGRRVQVSAAEIVTVPVSSALHTVKLTFGKTSYAVPEEDGDYERIYFIRGGRLIELREYEKVLLAREKARQGFFEKLLHRQDSNYAHLVKREEELRAGLGAQIKALARDAELVQVLGKLFTGSKPLSDSPLARDFVAVTGFRRTQE